MRDGLATPAKVLPVFRIKICGITNAQDAQHAARAGADAVGLNFYPASPRYIAPRTAAVIVDALPKDIVKTGVFVNATAAEICEIAAAAQLDLIQLHGDEPPELLRELSEVQKRPIMKAFRIDGGLDDVLNFLDKCSEMQCSPRLVMFDAPRAGGPQGGAYGGTGKLTNWDLARRYGRRGDLPPLVLAGGLSADNVAQGIRTVRPAAVDVASGVEIGPGCKDPAQVMAFVSAVRAAFDNL